MTVRRRRPEQLADVAPPRARRPNGPVARRDNDTPRTVGDVGRQGARGRTRRGNAGDAGADRARAPDGPQTRRDRGADLGRDHALRDDQQTARAEERRPDVAEGSPRATGHAQVGVGAEQAAIGGVAREAGLQTLPDQDPRSLETTNILLSRLRHVNGEQAQPRLQIGRETFTAGQLDRAVQENPERFQDFLREHGITVGELNEALDDIAQSNPGPNEVFDLRQGSALAQRYSLGDGVENLHHDAAHTERAAAGQQGLAEGIDLENQGADSPGFFEAIGDAFLEAFGWIGRLFGSDWDPDTATFDGALDEGVEQRFEDEGRRLAQTQGTALRALLSTPEGRQGLHQAMLADRPEGASEAQWARGVEATIRGIDAELATGGADAARPEFSASQAADAMTYLRSQGFSAEAQEHVDRVMAQPPEIRDQAMHNLVALPETERARMLDLMAPVGPEPEDYASVEGMRHENRRIYNEASPAAKAAIFQTLQQDGFRSPSFGGPTQSLMSAVDRSTTLSPEHRERFLNLLPQLGLERSHYAVAYQAGLLDQLNNAPEAERGAILDDFESRLASSDDLEAHLAAGQFSLRLTDARARPMTRSSDRRRAVGAFELHNVRLTLRDTNSGEDMVMTARGEGPDEISLDRYLSDRSYRADVLARTGVSRNTMDRMIRNVSGSLRSSHQAELLRSAQRDVSSAHQRLDDATTPGERAVAQQDIRDAQLRVRTLQTPMNVDLDARPGSRLYDTFDLGETGESPQTRLALQRLQSNGLTPVELTVRGSGGRTTVTSEEINELNANPPEGQTAREAFVARHPGVNYDETILAMVRVQELTTEIPESAVQVDLTRRNRDPGLERLRRQYVDRRQGNITLARPLTGTVGASTSNDTVSSEFLSSDARLGANAANNWFQYGIFQNNTGYYSSRRVFREAEQSFNAAGRTPNPRHALGALMGMDDHVDRHRLSDGNYRLHGTAHGQVNDFLVDPRTGAQATGRDISVLAFSGRGGSGDRGAFRRDAQRTVTMFERFGGVPPAQTEVHHDTSPDRLKAAVRAEILRDPRPEDQRTDAEGRERPRTVVVYMAGHTSSYSGDDDTVSGFMMSGPNGERVEMSPHELNELSRLAEENGVNLMFSVDACRAGSYVHEARNRGMEAADATGSLPPEVEQLNDLRDAALRFHQGLHQLSKSPSHRSIPSSDRLSRMAAAALRDGPGSASMTALTDLRTRMENDETLPASRDSVISVVDSVEDILTARAQVGAVDGMDPEIANNDVLNGRRRWRTGRTFKTYHLGPIADRITAEMRARTPAPTVTPRDED